MTMKVRWCFWCFYSKFKRDPFGMIRDTVRHCRFRIISIIISIVPVLSQVISTTRRTKKIDVRRQLAQFHYTIWPWIDPGRRLSGGSAIDTRLYHILAQFRLYIPVLLPIPILCSKIHLGVFPTTLYTGLTTATAIRKVSLPYSSMTFSSPLSTRIKVVIVVDWLPDVSWLGLSNKAPKRSSPSLTRDEAA